jgi:hypothetical protein
MCGGKKGDDRRIVALRASLFYFRTLVGQEVDVVMQRPNGDIVGIEIKASAAIEPRDMNGFKALGEIAGRRFRGGILLYTEIQNSVTSLAQTRSLIAVALAGNVST